MHRLRYAPVALAAAWLALLAGCQPQPSALEQIRARGALRVVTFNSPTSHYLGAHGTEGFEYQLATEFAQRNGVKLEMYTVPDVRAMQAELTAGRADLAAAQLTADASWRNAGQAAAVYEWIPQLVVYRRGHKPPRDLFELEKARFSVRAGSAQLGMLERLKKNTAPNLRWTAVDPRTADPLEDVVQGKADYALVDKRELSFARHLFPDLRVAFALPEERPAQWIVREGAQDLHTEVNLFFRALGRSGRLAAMAEQASGESREFQYLESLEFGKHVQTRLPEYRAWFEQASAETGVDWRLLAAMGYQESKWSPTAESADGAQGVMMLTASTAAELGVSDRTDPRQSIFGGAKYFVEVKQKIPERIPEPDRTWLAVAAYNVGFGHLEDARVLTEMRKKNPDSWSDVKEHLPLLAQERWYTQVKRGYARGWEPAQFVDRVQRYLTLLEWQPGQNVAREQAAAALREDPT